jgi:thymidylate synthase
MLYDSGCLFCKAMNEYHRLLQKVLDHGSYRGDRTGTGAYSVFGEQSRYDLSGLSAGTQGDDLG